MAIYSMRCPKCGLIQMASATCKSCGAPGPDPMASSTRPGSHPIPRATARPLPPSIPKETGSGETHRLAFHGTGGTLCGIYMVNLFLSIVTVGIYSFWGRVKVRRYLLSQTEFDGDRFAYHGSGKELFIGFLKAVTVFGIPMGLSIVVRDFLEVGELIKIGAAVVAYLIVLFIVPFAIVAARRYRLSRTSWRGIRFSFRGRVWDFSKLFVGGSLVTTVTLGLYYPFFAAKKYAFLVSHSYFGNEIFRFDGRGKELFTSYLLTLLLTVPTLGLCWFWFMAKKQCYFADHTSFATARFQSTVTGGALLRLNLGNLLLLIVTLGIGWAWVVIRNIRFVFTHVTVKGPLEIEGILQEAELAPATGEELAGFFDLDAGFDLG